MTDPDTQSGLSTHSLGRTRLKPTVLGLGGAPLGELFERLPEPQADEVVQGALAAGITFFDTAPWYGHGLSEHRIGRGLRQTERKRLIVSTKVGRVYRRPRDPVAYTSGIWVGGLPFEPHFDYSGPGILRSYEDSLLRLGLNRVECLVIHDLDRGYHSDTALRHHRDDLEASGWGTLDMLRKTGEIVGIGAGINDASLMAYFLERFDLDFFLVAMPYTLLDPASVQKEFLTCQERGIGIIIGSPFASGVLATGAVPGAVYNYAPLTESIRRKTRDIERVCERFAVALPAAALQFALAHPAVTAVIPGVTSRANITANIAHIQASIPTAFWDELKSQHLLPPDAHVPQVNHG
jgi:D-threo-aldose 1-dehydrogenase